MNNFLAEFRDKPEQLYDYVLWDAMIQEGVIVNKDGAFQTTFRYSGPDIDSSTEEEIVVLCEQINNVFKRIASGWVLYSEVQRRKSTTYVKSNAFPDPVTRLIEEERFQYFSTGNHYESIFYFTLIYLPPPDTQGKLADFIKAGTMKEDLLGEEHLHYFCEEADKIFNLFRDILPDVEALTGDETLTYLHSTISPHYHPVQVPEAAEHLDFYLYDSPLLGGFYPKLGDYCVRVISIRGFPGSTIPAILDDLNGLDYEFRWVTRFIFMDRQESEKETQSYTKLWYSKRESVGQLVRNFIFNTESTHVNEAAVAKSDDAAAATYEINNDISVYGYYTCAIVVMDRDEKEVNKKAQTIARIINNRHFVAEIEKYNAVDAFLGSIPGNCYSNKRRAMLSSRNLCHMLPISAKYSGPTENKHLQGPVLLYTETYGNTPFRFEPFVEDLGNTLVMGPPGAGKSAFLELFAAQYRKYKKANVYIFDSGGSSKVITAGVGGKFHELAAEGSHELSFQVLAGIDDPNERTWAQEWLVRYIEAQGLKMVPEYLAAIWESLTSVANNPVALRTMSSFQTIMNAKVPEIAQAIQPLILGKGALGKLFDAEKDMFYTGGWQAYEMNTLLDTPSAVEPTLRYIFHRIDKSLNGDPNLIIMDEFWKYLKTDVFVEKIVEWLRTLRKANTIVVFATQSLHDIVNSSIAAPIMDCCPTKVFLPNPNALEEKMEAMYNAFGLNYEEISMIATGIPKREYYYKSSRGSRKFSLALGKVALAYCGATGKKDQVQADELLTRYGPEQFNYHWLKYKQLPELAEQFKTNRQEEWI